MQKRLKGEKKKVTKLVVLKISFFLPYSIGFIFCGIFSKFISLSREKSTLKHFSDLLTLLKSHYPTIFFCRQSMKALVRELNISIAVAALQLSWSLSKICSFPPRPQTSVSSFISRIQILYDSN